MLARIIIVICMNADPSVCVEETPLYRLTWMECAVQGQILAAQVVEERPRWYLSRWRCEVGARREST